MDTLKLEKRGVPLEKASKALILLHGRGGGAQEILSLANFFCDNQFFIAAPQAPNRTWYPYSFMAEEKKNEPSLTTHIEQLHELAAQIAQFVPTDQIYWMGFSQGACLVLEITARQAKKYGGIAAFTGGLIGHTLNIEKYRGDFAGTKIFLGTRDLDPYVPLSRVEESKKQLIEMGAKVTLNIYPGMEHTINRDEIQTVRSFIFGIKD